MTQQITYQRSSLCLSYKVRLHEHIQNVFWHCWNLNFEISKDADSAFLYLRLCISWNQNELPCLASTRERRSREAPMEVGSVGGNTPFLALRKPYSWNGTRTMYLNVEDLVAERSLWGDESLLNKLECLEIIMWWACERPRLLPCKVDLRILARKLIWHSGSEKSSR